MTRRLLLVVAVLAALGGAGVLLVDSGSGDARDPAADRTGDTRAATWVDPDGDGLLERGPGEPLRPRTLVAGAPAPPAGGTLATVVQLTDLHVRDEESPARVTFLDRTGGAFRSTFRPHEALSAQVADGAVRAARALRPQLAVVTGDVTDNAQRNEAELAATVLRGGRVDPDAGAPGYEGPQQADQPDPAYYRPDVDPPSHPGLLAAAQRPFTAAGLGVPVAAVPGNHDLLLQGELPPTRSTDRVARGGELLVEPDIDLVDVPRDAALAPETVEPLLAGGLPGTTRPVGADPGRTAVTPAGWAAAIDGAVPAGRPGRVVDVGDGVRVVVLDLQRRDAGGGAATDAHAAFLGSALRTGRWVLVASHQPLRKVAGAERLRALLDRSPRVLATLAGDSHRNRITAWRSGAGGYWEVETASLADVPMQARALRVRALDGDRGAVLETWMLDTVGDGLPRVARDLAWLDAQGGRPQGLRGLARDRNAALYVVR